MNKENKRRTVYANNAVCITRDEKGFYIELNGSEPAFSGPALDLRETKDLIDALEQSVYGWSWLHH